jgi:hypothetical protein
MEFLNGQNIYAKDVNLWTTGSSGQGCQREEEQVKQAHGCPSLLPKKNFQGRGTRAWKASVIEKVELII